MENLNDNQRGGLFGLSKAGLAEGTNPNTIKTANIFDYCIDGVLFRKAITDNIAMTALAQQAADTTCCYLVQIDSAGAVSMKKGNEVLNTAIAAGTGFLVTPKPDAGKAPLGEVKVKTVAVTYTNGGTDLSAAGITATFRDFFSVPTAVQTS